MQPVIKTFLATNNGTSFEEVIMPIVVTDSTVENIQKFTITTPSNINNSLYILIK